MQAVDGETKEGPYILLLDRITTHTTEVLTYLFKGLQSGDWLKAQLEEGMGLLEEGKVAVRRWDLRGMSQPGDCKVAARRGRSQEIGLRGGEWGKWRGRQESQLIGKDRFVKLRKLASLLRAQAIGAHFP